MSRHRRAATALGLLLVILAFHLAVAWQDIGTLARNGFLYDDSFYAFQIARNIADGRGMTFDGIHATTGFQPLYVFLLVPAFMASGGDIVLPIYAALTMLAIFTALTAYIVFTIARRYVGTAASLAAAALWVFSPVVTKQSANGLETALATFMIALSAWYYIERIRPVDHPPPGRLFTLGLLLGVTVLSRIDGVLIARVMADYWAGDMDERLAQFDEMCRRHPVMVMHSLDDSVVHYSASIKACERSGRAKLVLYPTGGHFKLCERGSEAARDVMSFMASHEAEETPAWPALRPGLYLGPLWAVDWT